MKVIIVKCATYADAVAARVVFADTHMDYKMGIDNNDCVYVIGFGNIVKYYIAIKRLEKEITRGADYEIIETAQAQS